VYTFFYLPNYPPTAKFLNEEECGAILADLSEQAPNMSAKTFNMDQIKDMFKSATFVPFLMIWITHGIGECGISFVLPTVIYELGISNTAMSQVLAIPTFVLVFLILYGLAYFIHKKRLSPWVAGLGVEIVQIICYILLITVKQPVAKYIFVMVATAASQSFFAIIWPERIRAARGYHDGWAGDRHDECWWATHGCRWAADIPAEIWSDVSCELHLLDSSDFHLFGGCFDDLVLR
jgi:hypothetical protein